MAKYAELSPAELARHWEQGNLAVIPWGALEWHGDHLPLGLDGIVAEAFAARLVDRVGGVLLPTIWLPITTLPHPSSLSVRTETMRMILDDMLEGLHTSGARRVAIVTGHYAQGHLVELYEAAYRAMDDLDELVVFAATPLQPLGRSELLDHAARHETSQLKALRPDLVWLDRLPEEVAPRLHAVLGDHPSSATAEEGEQLIDAALDAWAQWMESTDRDAVEAHYKHGFDELQPYVDRFYAGSWEDALLAWWETK